MVSNFPKLSFHFPIFSRKVWRLLYLQIPLNQGTAQFRSDSQAIVVYLILDNRQLIE